MLQKAEQQEFKQCGVDLEGPTAQTVQMLEEVLMLPLLMRPCSQRVECTLSSDCCQQVKLQLLESLEIELHEWSAAGDKQRKKGVGQVSRHLHHRRLRQRRQRHVADVRPS